MRPGLSASRITRNGGLARTELPYLDTFTAAAEFSSFTKAAKALNLTQAAVSQRIQALEGTLGKALFQRRGGSVQVTEMGQKLYDYAQRILALHSEARRELGGQIAVVSSELALAASSVPGEYLLPTLLSIFREKYPHIHVRATVTDSVTVMQQVERGHASLGLVGQKVANPRLEFRHLSRDQMVLVVPAKHLLGRRKRIGLKELTNYPLVLREKGSGLRHCFERAVETGGLALNDLQVALELGSNEAIKSALQRGVGAAILSRFAVQKELKSGKLRAVAIRGLRCDREMFVVHDRRRVLALPARIFLSFLDTAHPTRVR
jgi:DNA-binding transcriptional LysR family regulator